MASVTIEEKRLRQLKQQLFGKEQSVFDNKTKLSIKDLNLKSNKVLPSMAPSIAALGLKQDLYKVAYLSAIALLIQFALFFAIRNGLIRFN